MVGYTDKALPSEHYDEVPSLQIILHKWHHSYKVNHGTCRIKVAIFIDPAERRYVPYRIKIATFTPPAVCPHVKFYADSTTIVPRNLYCTTDSGMVYPQYVHICVVSCDSFDLSNICRSNTCTGV